MKFLSFFSRRKHGKFLITIALSSQFFCALHAEESPQKLPPTDIVWRTVYNNEYSMQFDDREEFASDANRLEARTSDTLTQEKRLAIFPLPQLQMSNDAVFTISERDYQSGDFAKVESRLFPAKLPLAAKNPDALTLSTQVHAARMPLSQTLEDNRSLRRLSGESWLRALGRMPTRDELNAYRQSRSQPTASGVWISANSDEDQFARFASASQYKMIVAEGLWMASQGREGRRNALRGVAATVVTGALTVAVKKSLRRRRPYPNDQKFGAFPSGHTSTVFAMATVFAGASPKNKWLAYGSASLVGWSRIKVRAHHPHDVLAGALLGYYVGKKFAPKETMRTSSPVANINFKF